MPASRGMPEAGWFCLCTIAVTLACVHQCLSGFLVPGRMPRVVRMMDAMVAIRKRGMLNAAPAAWPAAEAVCGWEAPTSMPTMNKELIHITKVQTMHSPMRLAVFLVPLDVVTPGMRWGAPQCGHEGAVSWISLPHPRQ